MLKMVDGTGIIGVDMVCPLGGTVSPPQPPNYDNIEMEGVGSLMLPNSLKAPLERVELIGNSVQGENPAPDNPQEIKSAGRKSKNLLNLQKQPDVKETYLGWKVSDGRNVVLSVKDKGNNADITGCYLGLSRTGGSSDGVAWAVNNGSVVAKEVVSKNQYVSVFPSNETIVRKLLERFDIQVEYGNNATDYEPYGYFLDVKVTGKNLFSNKPTDWMIGKGLSWSTYPNDPISIYRVINSAVNVINLKPSTTYSIVNNSEKIVISRMIERNLSENGIKDHDVRSSKYTFVTNQNAMNAILQLKKVDGTELLSSDIESIKIMLVEGEANENAPYQPYTEQTVQIALNEPLRGIGEYKDTITKDGVVRKILKAPLVKYLKPVINGNVGDRYVFAEVPNANINYDRKRCMSNVGFTNSTEKKKYIPHPYQLNFLIRVADDDTIEMVKEKIKDIIVAYTTKDPVIEPLPESVQAQLQALHTENGTTHVFADSGEVECGIKLTYRKEK